MSARAIQTPTRDRRAELGSSMRIVSHVAAVCVALFLACVLHPSVARAEDRKAQRAAESALHQSVRDFAAVDYDAAAARLQKALRTCGANGCARATVAELWRAAGIIALQTKAPDATTTLAQAFKIDPNLDFDPKFDSADVRAVWPAARDEARAMATRQPSGDFSHKPAAEQTERTPLPIFVEYAGGQNVASVVVKYEATGMSGFERVQLARLGSGWGGYIPCEHVARGAVRYFIQGFDEHGEPLANSGDPKHPYAVPIRAQISGDAPSLPGKAAPRRCDGSSPPAETEPAPEPTDTEPAPEAPTSGPRPYARVWVGVAAGIDATLLPAAPGACKLSNNLPSTAPPYYCTTPDGQDFPSRSSPDENASLAGGGADSAGTVGGGVAAGSQRVMLSVDYAFSVRFLAGVRLGYVINSYPGQAAVNDGRSFSLPIHLELRGTYLFGEEPLARSGFAPLVFGGGGVSSFDANETVLVSRSGIAGQKAILAWRTGGPGMVDVGGGVRYAFSPRIATTLALKLAAFLGGSGIVPAVGPEMGVVVGF